MKKTFLAFITAFFMIVFLFSCSTPGADEQSTQDIYPNPASLTIGSEISKSAAGQALVEYTITNSWNTGFGASVKITNNGTSAIDGWTLTWTFDGDQVISSSWNTVLEQKGSKVSAQPVGWNAIIYPGQTVDFGFCANVSGDNPVPSDLTLRGAGGVTDVLITAPAEGTTYEEGALIAVSADAEDGEAAVSSVDFFANGTKIGSDTARPFEAEWTSNVTGTISLTARALYADGSSVDSAAVSVEIITEVIKDDDWLHVEGNKIVDQDGNAVWLTGANWFGFNTGSNCFDGLWACNLEEALESMADRGINLLRVPISTELMHNWKEGSYPMPSSLNDYINPDLGGKSSLEIFDATLAACEKLGIKVMVDVHSPGSDAMGHIDPMWYKGSITTDMFYDAWVWMAERYKNNDTIIAFDLENEPHGKPWQNGDFSKWDGSEDGTNWKYVAEECGKRILAVHPNVLIMVEGIEAYPAAGKDYSSMNEDDYLGNWWGGNLRGVKDYPVDLGANQDQLVYSPHDYGPLVWEQPWFKKEFTKQTLYEDCWKDNWAYIMEDNIAPLLIGEWGGFMDGGKNQQWMEMLRDYIIENKIHHTFWCYNANSGDTGGLVGHDFITWEEDKYELLKPALWQKDGKFVGLDHKVPLGGSDTGMTLTQYYLDGGTPPVPQY